MPPEGRGVPASRFSLTLCRRGDWHDRGLRRSVLNPQQFVTCGTRNSAFPQSGNVRYLRVADVCRGIRDGGTPPQQSIRRAARMTVRDAATVG